MMKASIIISRGWLPLLLILGIAFSVSTVGAETSLEEARVLIATDDLDAAIERLIIFTNQHPTDAEALYLLGYAYYARGQMDRAAKRFKEAYLVNPEFVPTASVGANLP